MKTYIRLIGGVVEDVLATSDISRMPNPDDFQETERTDLGVGMIYNGEDATPTRGEPGLRELVRCFVKVLKDNQDTLIIDDQVKAVLQRFKS